MANAGVGGDDDAEGGGVTLGCGLVHCSLGVFVGCWVDFHDDDAAAISSLDSRIIRLGAADVANAGDHDVVGLIVVAFDEAGTELRSTFDAV